MRINFFEEFPEQGSLAKAALIDFDSTVYIATKSFGEFTKWKGELAAINLRCEAAYWPILKKSYWVSPVANTCELEALSVDLASNRGKPRLKVLLDLELPLRRNFYAKNIFSFSKNRRLIKKIFSDAQENNVEILTAEYPASNSILQLLWRLLGLSYDLKKYPHRRIVMYYSSMIRGAAEKREWLVRAVRKFIRKKVRKNPELQVGLGAIDTGIFGNEPILLPEKLDDDFRFLKTAGVKTAVIFRLSGLNENYLSVIKK